MRKPSANDRSKIQLHSSLATVTKSTRSSSRLTLDAFAKYQATHPGVTNTTWWRHFLANVNSRSRSLYAVARPSVCRLSVCLSSVTLVHPTQAVQLFGNISTAFGTLAIHW